MIALQQYYGGYLQIRGVVKFCALSTTTDLFWRHSCESWDYLGEVAGDPGMGYIMPMLRV